MVVMLGYQDLQIKQSEPTTSFTNKLGGLPQWFYTDMLEMHPKCALCSRYLYQLVHIYCPLKDSPYHRVLNIFGCTMRECTNKPESIVVIRSQKLDDASAVIVSKQEIVDDDWGVNDWTDNGNLHGDDGWGDMPTEEEKSSDTYNVNGDVNDMSDITSCIEDLSVRECHFTSDMPQFVAYHIYVEEEGSSVATESNKYEMKLYEEYVAREGNVRPATNNTSNSNRKHAEKYEKTQRRHGDELFYQFKKRIRNSPTQCLRYEWNGKPLLLSERSKLYPSMEAIPSCSHCHSPRVFELQLMPSLVNYLHKGNSHNLLHENIECEKSDNRDDNMEDDNMQSNIHIDFGCIYIFSCVNSCWESGEECVRYEFPVLQPDPDIDILK